MILLTVLAAAMFVALALLAYWMQRPRARGIAGRPDPAYVPQQLPDTPFVAQPEEESESGFPWSITRKLEQNQRLTDAEEWICMQWAGWR